MRLRESPNPRVRQLWAAYSYFRDGSDLIGYEASDVEWDARAVILAAIVAIDAPADPFMKRLVSRMANMARGAANPDLPLDSRIANIVLHVENYMARRRLAPASPSKEQRDSLLDECLGLEMEMFALVYTEDEAFAIYDRQRGRGTSGFLDAMISGRGRSAIRKASGVVATFLHAMTREGRTVGAIGRSSSIENVRKLVSEALRRDRAHRPRQPFVD